MNAEVTARVNERIASLKTDLDIAIQCGNAGVVGYKSMTRDEQIEGIRRELTRIWGGNVPKPNLSMEQTYQISMDNHHNQR